MRLLLLPLFCLSAILIVGAHGTKKARQHKHLRTKKVHKAQRTPVVAACDDSCEFAFDGVCDDGSVDTVDDDDYYAQSYGIAYGNAGGEESSEPYYSAGYVYADSGDESEYQVSACVLGTDCTDCGGSAAPPSPVVPPTVTCDNTCIYKRDGVCDDNRGAGYCAAGTDCQDCGPVGADNFTTSGSDDGPSDDDDYWTFNNVTLIGNSTTSGGGVGTANHAHRHGSSQSSNTLVAALSALGGVLAIAVLLMVRCAYQQALSASETGDRDGLAAGSTPVEQEMAQPTTPALTLPLPAGVSAVQEVQLDDVAVEGVDEHGVELAEPAVEADFPGEVAV